MNPVYFYQHLDRFGQSCAVVTPDGNTVSYQDLQTLVEQFRETLPVSPELVFILAANELESLVAYLACLQAGHAVMLLDPALSVEKLIQLRDLYCPSVVIGGAVEIPNQLNIANLSNNADSSLNPDVQVANIPIHHDLGVLLSTSGSTGSPKQVRLSRQNLQANAVSIADYLTLSQNDRAITTLPFHYSYGLSVINSHLLSGATLLLTNDSVMSRSFWDFYDQFSPTSLSGVPHTYELLGRLKFLQRPPSTLRYLTQAGGRLSSELIVQFAQGLKVHDIEFFVMYGQTEATARMSYLKPEEVFDHPDSIGRPIPGGRFEIWDDEGRLIDGADTKGELVYFGDNIMMGYARSRADLSRGAELDWLKTGDIAFKDAAGRFFICGRKDRAIKVLGHRVDLEHLQSLLRNYEPTVLCAGEENRIVLAIVEENLEEDDIRLRLLKERALELLPVHHSIFSLAFIPEVPKTSNGKVSYHSVLQTVAASSRKLSGTNASSHYVGRAI